ncbi:MAG TPA: pitrilysin family protein [Candidatus Eisenbacteria bacterium]
MIPVVARRRSRNLDPAARIRRAAGLLAIVAALVTAPAALAAVKPPQVRLDFEKYTLPNGLEVILREDHRLPNVAVNIWYHVGPANETEGRTGFAHLFEHMMFQSSGHVGEDQIWKYLEGAGASFINGSTDFDRTNYLEDMPASGLEMALWLESDRMGFLLDRLTGPSLANQQDVVRNERRQSIENAPYQLAEEEMWHQLFPKGHPYYADVIGSHEDVQAAKLEDVKEFFRRYYCPNNASLVIIGDIDKAKTKAMVQKYFGTLPRGADVPPITATTPPITSEKRLALTDNVQLPHLNMGWITSPIFKPGDADAVVAANILGQGKASRLYKALVYDKQVAQSVSVDQQSLQLGSVFTISVTLKPDQKPDDVAKLVDAELDRFASEGPTQAEVDASQNAIYSQMVFSLEQIGGFDGLADRFNRYNQFLHDPGYLNKDMARYAAVTPASVKAFAQAQLKKDARVVISVMPGEKIRPPDPPAPPKPEETEKPVVSAEPWRNTPPSIGAASQAKLPAPKRFALPNGLSVYVVESHNLPLVSCDLVLRSGSGIDPKDAPGLAGFTSAMLDEGTTTRDALAIANQIHALGASLGTGSSVDGSSADVSSLKQNAPAAMSILADVVIHPAFPESEMGRVRSQRLTQLLQQRDQTFGTAVRVMNACLFGPTHAYGHTVLGTEAALSKISRADIETFYKNYYSPKNTALVMVGDVTEAEAKKLATDAFAGWQGAETSVPVPPAGATAGSRLVLVDKPGSAQSAVLAGQMGVARSDPDYEKLDVMNTVMGGLFSSRINMNLREDKGYSYGAFSFIGQNRGVGPLMAGAAVRSDATGPSIEEILKEVKKMKDGGVTDDELKLAKDSITRSIPANFETTGSTAGTLAQIYLFDLPLDYYQTLPGRVNAITKDDVLQAAQKHLTPDQMVVVVVGDKKVVEPQLSKLSLGAIAYRDADGIETQAAPATN